MSFEEFDRWIVSVDKENANKNCLKVFAGTESIQEISERKSGFGFVSYSEISVQKKSGEKKKSADERKKAGIFFCETITEKNISFKDLLEKFNGKEQAPANFIFPSKEKYLKKIEKLKEHIYRGDIYEINFCIEFVAENAAINPAKIFEKLTALSEAPHAMLARFGSVYVICSSPERFLQKKGSTLFTQPMKGTAKRGNDEEEDKRIKNELGHSLKEQTENVMAVDVARNDLSRIAKKGTVKTNELFGVYTFKQVHQMVSTVSCELKEGISFSEVIEATFPPASMTGAPKIRAIELIDQYEDFDRGMYSGVMGKTDSNGDFDLAVVIRTIIYDSEKKRVSFAVGSAITALSDPEKEWEECMLKARAMIEVLK
ncbi:MAG: anthranilate synthase component I family protein [Bacteroidia bacterium]|nr:anthranilate synthase component I family protein [Bacteroidia bacterium]